MAYNTNVRVCREDARVCRRGSSACRSWRTCSGWWTTFLHASYAGRIIALLVWVLPGAEHDEVAVIIVMTGSSPQGLCARHCGLERGFLRHMAW